MVLKSYCQFPAANESISLFTDRNSRLTGVFHCYHVCFNQLNLFLDKCVCLFKAGLAESDLRAARPDDASEPLHNSLALDKGHGWCQ